MHFYVCLYLGVFFSFQWNAASGCKNRLAKLRLHKAKQQKKIRAIFCKNESIKIRKNCLDYSTLVTKLLKMENCLESAAESF